MQLPHITPEAIEKFWSRVDIRRASECWEWSGYKTTAGYGRFLAPGSGRECYAHRISYLLHYGVDPGPSFVCHSCDNPCCVNPHHLWLGDYDSNARDKVDKGRSNRGERHGMVKITEGDVIAIRAAKEGGAKSTHLSRTYGISVSMVNHIAGRRSWKHIP